MKKWQLVIGGLAVVQATLWLEPLPALAQQEDPKQLEEVIVTAQKRAESLQDVPVSVSAFSANDLESLKLGSTADIAKVVPNLQATNIIGDGMPIFSLRGISMADYSLNQLSPIAVYVDEVYKGNPAIQGVQMFDIERLEVLRGPQGTLYGKNTTGGAVNFITRNPSMATGGELKLGVGSYSSREIDAAFETALIEDVLGFRIAGTWNEADGWFENRQAGVEDANAIDEYGVRATLLWQPSNTFTATLKFASTRQDAVNYSIKPINIIPDGVGAGLYGLYNLLGVTSQIDYQGTGADFFETDTGQDEKRRVENDSVALTIDWEFSEGLSLTSITSWDDGEAFNPEDADGSPNMVAHPIYFGTAEQVTQDLRLSSNYDGPFNFIAGAYFANEDVYNQTTLGLWTDLDFNADGALDYLDCLDPFYTLLGLGQVTPEGAALETILNSFGTSLAAFAPGGCQLQNDFDQERDSYAGYFDGNWEFSDTTMLRVGLRYTRDKTSMENFSARLIGNDFTPLASTIPGDPVDPFATLATDSFTDKEWTGKLGVDFRLDSGALVYASFSHGYRSGAYNAQAFFDPSEFGHVAPETVNSFEVGIKTELMDSRVRFNAAAFYYDYADQQFLDVDPATAVQTLVNVEESEIMGLEAELTAIVSENLLIRAGLGILSTEVKKGVLSGVDLKGNDLPLAPSTNFNLTADWTALNFESGSVSVIVDASYVGDHHFDIFNLDRIKQDAYWLWNGRIQYDSASENWAVAIWGKNLAEEEYLTSAVDLSGFGYDYTHIGAPRTYGAEIIIRF